jgi:hypothetical protein
LFGYAFNLGMAPMADFVVSALIAVVGAYYHLKLISPENIKRKAWGLAMFFITGFGLMFVMSPDRWKREFDSAAYTPYKIPELQLGPVKSVDQLLQDFSPVKEKLDKSRADKQAEEDDLPED